MLIDPAVAHIATATVAIVFLVGAWQKLRHPMAFEIAIEGYALAPDVLVRPLSYALPLAEATAAILLLLPATRLPGSVLATLLMVVVTGAVAVNLLRGHTDVGCGCGGLEDEQLISWWLVLRNVLLIAVILGLNLATVDRPLMWMDAITVAAGTLAAYGIYVMVNQLIANQPRLLSLRHGLHEGAQT